MIPEEIWYLFIFPWILFIANIPGAVITYMALGAVATFSAYIPGLGGSKDSWKSDLNSDSINFKISCQKGWWSFITSFIHTVISQVFSLFESVLVRFFSSVDLRVTKNWLPETIKPDAVAYLYDPEVLEAFQVTAWSSQ